MNSRLALVPRFGQDQKTYGNITKDASGKLVVPNYVTIPAIAGDGIGPEIMPVAQRIVNAAVQQSYGDKRSIAWLPVIMGVQALEKGQGLIPEETVEAIKKYKVAVKGPLTTAQGGGHRSVNVGLRKLLGLFSCERPVKYIAGIASNLKEKIAQKIDVVIFRENTEDLYKGAEFPAESHAAKKVIAAVNEQIHEAIKNPTKGMVLNTDALVDEASAVGIKAISEEASKKLIRKAFKFAIENNRPSVTLVGKDNIMKYTEGAFIQWGMELAQEEFPGKFVTEKELEKVYNWDVAKVKAEGKLILKTRITDNMFQEVITKPDKHSVIATMNVNGDYLSDAFAADIGGLGVAPGTNIGDDYAVFEATHGTAPDIVGKNMANPTALLLSMELMLKHMGWDEAATRLRTAIERTIGQGKMTGDIAIPAEKTPLSTTDYASAVIENLADAPAKPEPPKIVIVRPTSLTQDLVSGVQSLLKRLGLTA